MVLSTESVIVPVLVVFAFIRQMVVCVFVQTLRTEGVAALYRGFVPSYLRVGPWNIIVSSSLNPNIVYN